MQDTWLPGSFSTDIRGNLLFNHSMEKKAFHRCQRSSRVAIILGPVLIRACNMAGKLIPITSTKQLGLPRPDD